MDDAAIPALFITANIGSIFEDPQNLLKTWTNEFLSIVKKIQPKFLALHCQELGGKSCDVSMRHVEDFVRMLMASEELREFGQVRVYLDEDFTCIERYTALGNLYFIHNGLKNVQIWDYADHKFHNLEGKEVHSGNIERVTTKEKAKFPHELFPEYKGSRKGFMRTRWNVCETVFDLINVHLFHDASNFVAMESFPSVYSKNRQNALSYALQRFSEDEYESVPYFIFGDFNFRLNAREVIQKLTTSLVPVHFKSPKNGEIEKILYKDRTNENKVILTLEKKVFDLNCHQDFFNNGYKSLQEFDRELEMFQDVLFEFDKEFPPTYPFCEDIQSASSYEKTRCPAWCDRILLSKSARSLVDMSSADSRPLPVQYEVVGADVTMGDHKPVMLLFRLQPHKGRLPPFTFKSQALDMCVLQSHLPSHRTLSHPSLLSSDGSYMANEKVNKASYMLNSCHPCYKESSDKPDLHSSVIWPFVQLRTHPVYFQKWRVQTSVDSNQYISTNGDKSRDILCLGIQIESSNIALNEHSATVFESKDVLGRCPLLHAYPTKHYPYPDVKKNYKCCPCVLL